MIKVSNGSKFSDQSDNFAILFCEKVRDVLRKILHHLLQNSLNYKHENCDEVAYNINLLHRLIRNFFVCLEEGFD